MYPHEGGELVVERIARSDDGTTFLPSLFAPDDETTARIVLSTAMFQERLRDCGSARPLLVFDQFEELITLFDDPAHTELQRRIAELLVALLRDGTVPAKLLFVFREDYLASVKQLLGAAPELIDQALRLTPPAAESLTRIIRGPFERFPGHYPRELSPSLTERLCLKLGDRFGSGAMSLSEVQTVCLRLWLSEDPGPLLERSGVQGLLEDYLGEELDAFPPEQKYAAVALLSGLVTAAGTRNVLSAESLIDHVQEEEGEIPTAVLEGVLKQLEEKSKLVRREKRRDIYLYEITSEFLVPWISQRRDELIRARERKKEKRRLKLLGLAVFVLLVVIAIVAGLALTVYASLQDARAAKSAAEISQGSEVTIVLSAAADKQPSSSDQRLLLSLMAIEKSRRSDMPAQDAALTSAVAALDCREEVTSARHASQPQRLRLAPRLQPERQASPVDGRLGNRQVLERARTPPRASAATRRATAFRPTQGKSEFAVSPDGTKIVTVGDRDGMVRLWSVSTHTEIGRPFPFGPGATFATVTFDPTGKMFATVPAGGKTITLWSVATRRPVGTPLVGRSPQHRRTHVQCRRHGTRRVHRREGGALERRRPQTARPVVHGRAGSATSARGRTYPIEAVALTPNGAYLATAGASGVVRVWSTASRKVVAVLDANAAAGPSIRSVPVYRVVFSPDGKQLAAAGEDGKIRLWSVATRRAFRSLVNGRTAVVALAYSPDGQVLASGDGAGVVKLWDARQPAPNGAVLGRSPDGVDAATFSPNGRIVAGADVDGTVRLWNVRTQTEIGHPLRGHGGRVWTVAFSPDGRVLASGGKDRTIRLWDVARRRTIGHPLRAGALVWSVAFSPDGRTLVSGDEDRTVRVWDVSSGKQLGAPLLGHRAQVNGVAVSPDGRFAASAASDGTVRLWNLETHKPVGRPLKMDSQGANSVAFSPDGRTLAAAGIDGTLFVWSLATHKKLWDAVTSNATVFGVAFSPNGKLLATTGDDGFTDIWSTVTHRKIEEPFAGHRGWVFTVSFAPDNRTIATAGHDSTIRLWTVRPRPPVPDPVKQLVALQRTMEKTVCLIVGRTLTPHAVAVLYAPHRRAGAASLRRLRLSCERRQFAPFSLGSRTDDRACNGRSGRARSGSRRRRPYRRRGVAPRAARGSRVPRTDACAGSRRARGRPPRSRR